MSTRPHASPVADAAPRSPRQGPLPTWLREPLLHFVAVGALLFAVDHYLVAQADNPRVIVIGSEVTGEAKRLFRESRGREPNSEELDALSRRWIDNEILYREGLAMGVDQGDKTIRDRIIFKSLMLVETGLKLPPIDDRTLKQWFETNRAKYDEPARYDFQEAVLVGDASEAAKHDFARALNAGTPGEATAGLRVFKGRPQSNLVQSYGEDFAKNLERLALSEWHVLPTRDGLRVMRVDAITPAKPATFEALRSVVLPDWTDATMAQQRTDAVRERGKKYTVKFEGDAP